MMLRSLGIGMLAVGLAIPAVAQQKDPSGQQNICNKIEAVTAKYMEAVNKGDATGASSPFTANGLSITPYGVNNTREKMEATTQMVRKMGINLTMKVEEVQPAFSGQGAIANGGYSATYIDNPATPQVQGNFFRCSSVRAMPGRCAL